MAGLVVGLSTCLLNSSKRESRKRQASGSPGPEPAQQHLNPDWSVTAQPRARPGWKRRSRNGFRFPDGWSRTLAQGEEGAMATASGDDRHQLPVQSCKGGYGRVFETLSSMPTKSLKYLELEIRKNVSLEEVVRMTTRFSPPAFSLSRPGKRGFGETQFDSRSQL